MKIFLRKNERKYEISDRDDSGRCHIHKFIDQAEFDQAFAFYSCNPLVKMKLIDDNGQSEEFYEITILQPETTQP